MDNNNKNIIEFHDVSKIFKNNQGIKNVNFKVLRGNFHALIGSNGAGKTTIIRSLLRLYQKFGGEIKVEDIDNKYPEAMSNIGYISEAPKFPGEFSAFKYLLWAGKLSGQENNSIKGKINQLVEDFEFQGLINKNPNKFSSGQKQKLLLMKVLIEQKEVIVLDEPTANLNPAARIVFFNEIIKLNKTKNTTILISSHNLDEIEKICTWATIINKGKIVFDGKKEKNDNLKMLFKKYVFDFEGLKKEMEK